MRATVWWLLRLAMAALLVAGAMTGGRTVAATPAVPAWAPAAAGQAGDEDDEDEDPTEDEDTAGDEEEEENGDDGGDEAVYESPQYGYTLTYDAAEWEVVDETTDEGGDDLLFLTNGVSNALLVGQPRYDGDLEECLAAWEEGQSAIEGVDDWEPLEDEDGEPVAGEDDDRAWAAFAFDYTGEDQEEVERVIYVECRVLVPEESVVVLLHNVRAEDYEDEVDAFEALFEGLEVPEAEAEDEDDADEDEDADEDADQESDEEDEEDEEAGA